MTTTRHWRSLLAVALGMLAGPVANADVWTDCSAQAQVAFGTALKTPWCEAAEGNYGLPGQLYERRAEERAFAEGRGPDPRTKESLDRLLSVRLDPLL